MTVCVTGATGFIGAHVAQLLARRWTVRVTYRDETRLERLGDLDVEPIQADILDRAALRRAFRGCELVFHAAATWVPSRSSRVWEVNALAPRLAVEAAAAEDVRRVVVTSSVAGIGPAPPAARDRGRRLPGRRPRTHLLDAKHEGESEALAAGARLGVEVVVVNPSYVLRACRSTAASRGRPPTA